MTIGSDTTVCVDKQWLNEFDDLLGERGGPGVTWSFVGGLTPNEKREAVKRAAVFVGSHLSAETIEQAHQLQLVQTTGAGIEKIAVDALPAGVLVAGNHHHQRAIAEYVVAAMVLLNRRILEADRELRLGRWQYRGEVPTAQLPRRLDTQTILLLGYGRIGKEVSLLARSLGMRTIAISRSGGKADPSVDVFGVPSDLPRLAGEADHVVVLVPSTTETLGMVDSRFLNAMRQSASLINVSRGPVVVERDLYHALRSKKIAGAAVDVWYRYPQGNGPSTPSELPFHELPNVLMTPHMSAITHETYYERACHIAENVRRFEAGEPLQCLIGRA